jgi:hypothetical protein
MAIEIDAQASIIYILQLGMKFLYKNMFQGHPMPSVPNIAVRLINKTLMCEETNSFWWHSVHFKHD